jgi:hypothetical protein
MSSNSVRMNRNRDSNEESSKDNEIIVDSDGIQHEVIVLGSQTTEYNKNEEN